MDNENDDLNDLVRGCIYLSENILLERSRPMELKYIGKSLEHPDAISKATGKAVYIDDIRIPGLLHAAILRLVCPC